jgi:hypothetical protein
MGKDSVFTAICTSEREPVSESPQDLHLEALHVGAQVGD